MNIDSIVLDYSIGSFFYLTNPFENDFTCNILNLPFEPYQTYRIELIIDISYNKVYSKNITISRNSSIDFNIIEPVFTNNINTILDSSSVYIKQEIMIMNDSSGNILKVFSNLLGYDLSYNDFIHIGMNGGIIKTDIIPLKDNTINLGSSTSRFKEIWVYDIHTAPFTLYIGNASISSIDNKITLS